MKRQHETRTTKGGVAPRCRGRPRTGMDPRRLWYHQALGYCIAPTATFGGGRRRYYRDTDVDRLREYFAEIDGANR